MLAHRLPFCSGRLACLVKQHTCLTHFRCIQHQPRLKGTNQRRLPLKALSSLAKEANVDNSSSLEGIREIRLEKVRQLREANKEPYAFSFARTHLAAALHNEHRDLPAGSVAELAAPVAVAGRVRARRIMGKLAFISIQDDSGQIQLYVDKKQLDAEQPGSFAGLKSLLDIGDIVGVQGGIRRTDKGELSVVATSIQILTKSLAPLPEKWHGLADAEKRFRQRYVDMIVTEGVRDTFRARAKMTSTIRRTLEDKGFLEVETPVLEASAGGADAKPFITYHNALQQRYALRIATELHLKRLVVGGLERVFEIGRIFRNEGVSARHNPEFTSVEIYQAYADYYDIMDLSEELIGACANAVVGKRQVEYQGQVLDLRAPFRRASMHELVQQALGVDFEELTDVGAAREAAEKALKASPDVSGDDSAFAGLRNAGSVGEILNLCFEAAVEQTLQQPTFVMDHPVEVSPLAKAHRSKPGRVERFELFIAGRELANAFSELTDPVEQRARFQAQLDGRRKVAGVRPADTPSANGAPAVEVPPEHADEEAFEITMDEDFISALEIGLPPTGGIGIGIDRLCMLLTDKASIREVIAFPLMRAQ